MSIPLTKKINDQLYDTLGNLKQNYEIIQYIKYTDDKWVEEKRFDGGDRRWFVLDGKIYFQSGTMLLEANMDFESDTCGSCYQVGDVITGKKQIVANEKLFRIEPPFEKGVPRTLYKQSYSDGTCFYSFKDDLGNAPLYYSGQSLERMIWEVKGHRDRVIRCKSDCEVDEESLRAAYQELIDHYTLLLEKFRAVEGV